MNTLFSNLTNFYEDLGSPLWSSVQHATGAKL